MMKFFPRISDVFLSNTIQTRHCNKERMLNTRRKYTLGHLFMNHGIIKRKNGKNRWCKFCLYNRTLEGLVFKLVFFQPYFLEATSQYLALCLEPPFSLLSKHMDCSRDSLVRGGLRGIWLCCGHWLGTSYQCPLWHHNGLFFFLLSPLKYWRHDT